MISYYPVLFYPKIIPDPALSTPIRVLPTRSIFPRTSSRLQKKGHTFEFLRSIAHLRPRTNTFGAIARLRSQVSKTKSWMKWLPFALILAELREWHNSLSWRMMPLGLIVVWV